MQHRDNKEQVATKNEQPQIELTTMADYQQVINENVNIENDLSKKTDIEHVNLNQERISEPSKGIKITVDYSDDIVDNFMKKKCRLIETHSGEPISVTTNIVNGSEPELGPIFGYAAEPLLPLSKACAPLDTIVNNLSHSVKLALDETLEQPPDGLTIDEMLLEAPFKGANFYPKTKRDWYRKKRFAIPICLAATVSIMVVILGSVLGTRSNFKETVHVCDAPFNVPFAVPDTYKIGHSPVSGTLGYFTNNKQLDMIVVQQETNDVTIW
ncbi:hypothetical protein I4U23_031324 [Adineta vaga]|nr:hypothetical protein I4U23_031324 [Adineta vaga]